ncbi:Histone-lysine N-methyltransferase SETMAR, partial [Habropoda laboriosa]
EKYCKELEEMHKKLFVKEASLVNRKGPILLHDSDDTTNWVMKHPPYSPDIWITFCEKKSSAIKRMPSWNLLILELPIFIVTE